MSVLRARSARLGIALALTALLLPGCGGGGRGEPRAAMSRACQWLQSQQQSNGAIALRGKILNPNVWETANAVIALQRCDPAKYSAAIGKAFEFLEANWIDTGGLPESMDRRLSPHTSHCVETTSTAIHAYAAAGKRAQVERLKAFLFSVQETDGGWKIGYPEAAMVFPNGAVLELFPSVTGFALAGTVGFSAERTKAERGLAWLTAHQKPAGDWGGEPDYFWTPYYATAQIVAAFVGWGRRDDPTVARAIRYTVDHQNADGSWGDASDPLTPSRELWTALALLTLQAAGDAAPRAAVDRGIAYLLGRQQSDGRWIGGYFKSILVVDSEKKEDGYATSLVVLALSQSLDKDPKKPG